MILTDEQNKIIEAMKRPDCKLIKINAVSGAGKSSTLVEIAKALKIKSGLYISYNKAIATEASEKFSAEVLCKTIHSLAYGYTMSSFPLRLVPTLKARMITESIPAIRKSFLVDILSKYMLSREITIADFVEKYYKDKVSEDEIILMRDYFIKMKEGKIECSHDFYLKLFHILMHHKIIKTPEYDILMMDESGDITGVSLEIFKLIRANKKVMVGDSQQNIYSFNQTINGFEALSDEGEQLTLSQSFRVSTSLAPYVKEFCNTYLDPHMDFEGFPYKAMPEPKDITMFYIARTNSGIISRMIELDLQGRRYNLTRPVYSIFALPLLLLRLNKTPDSEIRELEFKFLEADMKEWMTNPDVRKTNESPLAYILSQHSDDTNISSAMNLLRKFSPWQIIQTYQNAKSHEKSSTTYKITITSAHSSKGLQADIVQIEPDLNEALHKVIERQQNAAKERLKADKEIYGSKFEFKYEKHALFNLVEPDMSLLPKDAIEEFRLYYVAITRAKFQLQHAEWLTSQEVLTTTISMMHSRGNF